MFQVRAPIDAKYLEKIQGYNSYIQVLTSAYTASCRRARIKAFQEGLGEELRSGTAPLVRLMKFKCKLCVRQTGFQTRQV